jgi:hypothetical protein
LGVAAWASRAFRIAHLQEARHMGKRPTRIARNPPKQRLFSQIELLTWAGVRSEARAPSLKKIRGCAYSVAGLNQ